MTGEDGQPSAFELGQLIGKYDESMKNINGCLKTINRKLDTGNREMNDINSKIDDVESNQKLENERLHNEINNANGALNTHRQKRHLYKVTDEEGRMKRTKRHWVEILLGGSVGTGGVIGLIILLIEKGVI